MLTTCVFQAGPIRLFTPYKRKRKARDDFDNEQNHKPKDGSQENSNDDSDVDFVENKDSWSGTSQGNKSTNKVQESNAKVQENGSGHSKYHKLDELASKLQKIANEFKKVVEEYKAEESSQKKKEEENVKNNTENVHLEPASNANKKKVRSYEQITKRINNSYIFLHTIIVCQLQQRRLC